MHIGQTKLITATALLGLVMAGGSVVSAQEVQDPPRVAERDRGTLKIRDWPVIAQTSASEERPELMLRPDPARQSSRFQTSTRPGKYNAAQRALISAGMGVAGFFAGGYIGAQLEPPCRCDDPGLKGFMIGAPVGAVAGAIFGAWLAR